MCIREKSHTSAIVESEEIQTLVYNMDTLHNQKVWLKRKKLELISCLCINVHHGDRLNIFSQEVIIKLRPLEGADYEAVSVE